MTFQNGTHSTLYNWCIPFNVLFTWLIFAVDLTASTGGLLGLFIGFSFISAVEVLYFATVRLWCGIAGKRNNIVESYPFVK
jgi:hypothetical protein